MTVSVLGIMMIQCLPSNTIHKFRSTTNKAAMTELPYLAFINKRTMSPWRLVDLAKPIPTWIVIRSSHHTTRSTLNTCMFSWRIKLEKLLCLKCLGNTSLENSMTLRTRNDTPLVSHSIKCWYRGSLTRL